MEITEVRIKLMDDPHDRLQAFCSITLNGCFVIRDLKIIQGTKGSFVAMPSRKLTDRCPRCHNKNHLRAHYCNQCGARLDEDRATRDCDGRAKLYADIAHPINSRCRDDIQDHVLAAYEEETQKAKLPGYVCTYDDYGEENYAALGEAEEMEPAAASGAAAPGRDGSHRRFEPAAEEPAGPHRGGAGPRERVAARVSDDEEEFGAGIV